ncbi:hypothetical protein PUN28_006788 [Cardiocondyla obscurior]|uniref:Uncharacterized protein n=1 Tax=Cardiocondyla obscurior TaxID=286306 RepID=A0AAW2FZX8_9HYME
MLLKYIKCQLLKNIIIFCYIILILLLFLLSEHYRRTTTYRKTEKYMVRPTSYRSVVSSHVTLKRVAHKLHFYIQQYYFINDKNITFQVSQLIDNYSDIAAYHVTITPQTDGVEPGTILADLGKREKSILEFDFLNSSVTPERLSVTNKTDKRALAGVKSKTRLRVAIREW